VWSNSKYSPVGTNKLSSTGGWVASRSQSSSVVTERAIPTRSSAGFLKSKYSFVRVLEWGTLQLPVSGLKRQVLLTYIGFYNESRHSKVTEPRYEYSEGGVVGLACLNWHCFSPQVCWTVSAFQYTKRLNTFLAQKKKKGKTNVARNWIALEEVELWGGLVVLSRIGCWWALRSQPHAVPECKLHF